MENILSHSAPIFPVDDVENTVRYYEQQLGFNCSFKMGTPPEYAVMRRGEGVSIHLVKRSGPFKPSAYHAALLIFVNDVDALYQEFQSKKVVILNPIGDRVFGMRDFDIRDPNGYILIFSMSLERLST